MRASTSVGQVGPVDDSVALQVPIESLPGQRHPGDGDHLGGLGQSQDVVRRPGRNCRVDQTHNTQQREDVSAEPSSPVQSQSTF